MIAAIIAGRSKMRAMLGQLVRKGGVPRQMSAIPVVFFAVEGLRGRRDGCWPALLRKTQPARASRQISRAQKAAFSFPLSMETEFRVCGLGCGR
jgi:hypothetical protein